MCTTSNELVSFGAAEDLVQAFRRFLSDHDIPVPDDSELGIACASMTNILLRHWDAALRDPNADIRKEFRDALALHAFLDNILDARNHAGFPQFLEHLKNLTKGGVRQNQWTSILDRLAPKLFELLIGLAAMHIGSGITLDHPTKSSGGTNPDVIVTIEGARWAFACKMLNTYDEGYPAKTKAYFDNIKDGVRQINNADVDHGLVIVSMKNAIDHNKAWPLLNPDAFKNGASPEYGSHHTAAEITDYFASAARKFHHDMLDEQGMDNVHALFAGSKARPVAVQYLHTVAAVTCCDTTMATPLQFLFAKTDDLGRAVADKLNRALQHRQYDPPSGNATPAPTV
jgi:hypothetical protein